MIAIDEADRLRLRARLQHLRAALEFEVLDHRDDVAIGEDIAAGVLHHARSLRRLRDGPFVTARQAFMMILESEDLVHFTHRANGGAHEVN